MCVARPPSPLHKKNKKRLLVCTYTLHVAEAIETIACSAAKKPCQSHQKSQRFILAIKQLYQNSLALHTLNTEQRAAKMSRQIFSCTDRVLVVLAVRVPVYLLCALRGYFYIGSSKYRLDFFPIQFGCV